jgi:AraC-like DNA-binding protein
MSPFELIRKIRMSKVASSSREGDANISEVAYRFGFNDMKIFRVSFKKEYGQTPTDYIKANQ